MKDKTLSAALRLVLCPGECNNPEICSQCPHAGHPLCAASLRQESSKILLEYLNGQPSAPKPKLESHVTGILHEIGVPAHIKGYQYLRCAITLVVQNPKILNSIVYSLYPAVAKEFDSTSSKVERAMRHAITVAWDRGDLDTLQWYFGNTVSGNKGKPTNSEFIALIADKISLEMRGVQNNA